MPTPLAHFCVPLLARELTHGRKTMPWKLFALGLFCSAAPDLDVLAFKVGIPYGSQFGHRGFTHSIAFGLFAGLVLSQTYDLLDKTGEVKRWTVFWFTSLAWVSHGALDALTTGGLGIAFFWPVDNTRHFLPWTVIKVSPIGLDFFSERGLRVLVSELKWVVLPCAVLLAAVIGVKKLTVQTDK